MTTTAITNVRLASSQIVRTPRASAYRDQLTLVIRDGIIHDVVADSRIPSSWHAVDGRGLVIAPGYVDIHVHGGGGYSLMTDDIEEVRAYARWVVRHGATSFLISTSGRDHAEILYRLRTLAPAVGVESGAARVLGFHLEGPYINPVRKGAFDSRWLRPPSVSEYHELVEASGGNIRMMTLAPELPDADELIRAVINSGATAAMGHTDATYDQARHAIDVGVSHVTHCFNAMRPFGHRDPGVLGAVMTSDDVTAELIADGAHVDFSAARLLVRAKGTGKIVLVTDAMPLAGTPDGEGEWEGVRIRIEGGKAVRVNDGTIIGGVTTLDQMVRSAVKFIGVASYEAIAMATLNPAAALRLGDEFCGSLSPGCTADFLLLDDELRVMETWVAGARTYSAADT